MHILYFTAEQWPTFRVDITILFGKYLQRLGITCDLVTEQDANNSTEKPWPAGKAILCKVPKSRAGQYVVKFLHQFKTLMFADYKQYQAVQVRDMTMIALLALIMCKLHKKPFYYWLSYPQSEGQIDRALARGKSAGMRYWFPLIQGYVGKLLLYKIILPKADHILVQSQNMLEMLKLQGIASAKMTPVPMGVDLEIANPDIKPSDDTRLKGKRVLVYLGTLDKVRQIEMLFHVLVIIKQKIPNIMLILAGDTEDVAHRAWLKQEAGALNIAEQVLFTGWLPMLEAWRFVRAAEIGISPFPRGYLLDMASPTKAVEYMAFGLPVVGNDNPDQAQVIAESSAGLCVKLEPDLFANTLLNLLNNPQQQAEMALLGQAYAKKVRGYDSISEMLAGKYQQLNSTN